VGSAEFLEHAFGVCVLANANVSSFPFLCSFLSLNVQICTLKKYLRLVIFFSSVCVFHHHQTGTITKSQLAQLVLKELEYSLSRQKNSLCHTYTNIAHCSRMKQNRLGIPQLKHNKYSCCLHTLRSC
jgi:hypothetical protein